MSKKDKIIRNGIITIVIFVLLLALGFVYVQRTYSNKIKSIKLTVSSGPVSPEFQQTQTIIISKDSCTFTTFKVQAGQTTTDNCTIQPNKFEQIQKDAETYGLIDKIIANQNDSPNDLLGGKKYTFQITLNDGSTFTTEADNNFIQNLEPFFDSMNLYVPQFSRLGL